MSSLLDLAPCVMKDTELEKKPVPNSSRTMFVVRQEALMSSLWDLASLLAILSVTGSFVALRLKALPPLLPHPSLSSPAPASFSPLSPPFALPPPLPAPQPAPARPDTARP